MTSEEIMKLFNHNCRLSYILGSVISLLHELKESSELNLYCKEEINWILQAIENVVYLNKGLPPMENKQ